MYQLGRLLHSEKTVRSTDQQKRWCLAGWERWQQWQGCPLAQSGCWTRTTTRRSWKAPCRDFHGPSELRRSSKGFPGFISSSGLAVIWCPLNIQIAGVYSLSKATRRRPGRARSSYGSCWDGTEGGHCEHISCYFWFWDRFQCFLHKIRFRKPAQISLHSALGAQDMDTMGPHFTGALSICRKNSVWFLFQDYPKFHDTRWGPWQPEGDGKVSQKSHSGSFLHADALFSVIQASRAADISKTRTLLWSTTGELELNIQTRENTSKTF